MQRAANALTAENLPASIFSLIPSTMSHTGERAFAGLEIQACLCGLLSLQALQLNVSVELLPGKSFPTSHPSTVTAGETILEPVLGILESFGIIYSRHFNAYHVVRQALGWPAAKSHLSSRTRLL